MKSMLVAAVVALTLQAAGPIAPDPYFGIKIGADGELARYPKIVEYLQHLAKTTNRVRFEEIGKTTMGNPYVLATISAPENLAKLNRLVEINRRLADPRGLSGAEARKLAQEGRAFYFVYGTIHSTEVGNTQSLIEIAHRLATDNGADVRQILDNVVVLLVPSQNPDGQYLVVDHWYKTRGTPFNRTYPDLYHKYVGHDDNRDWFMFTQKETRLAVQIQNRYKPIITHDMHQMGSGGARIFVPPFDDPYDPNVHAILRAGISTVGQAMASALVSEGKGGVEWLSRYDLWAPARQYMVYHGQPRILTEIASVNLADPLVNQNGAPMGPQETRWNFPLPYRRSDWRLRDIVDYGNTVAFAGMAHVAKYRTTWLENFYKVHADWVNRTEAPYAFVVPAAQRDPFETFELLDILRIAEVEIHQAQAPFKAGGKDYGAGSWVIRTAQPYGAFAKTMLERQKYPDLRLYPGGPPKPPYDVTGHTLGMLMGVDVDQIDQPFDAALEPVKAPRPVVTPLPAQARSAYIMPPAQNAAFMAVARLQAANVPVFRVAGGTTVTPGTWVVPVAAESTRILTGLAQDTGLIVEGADRMGGELYRLKPHTRIGLWRGANNMPAGWLKWLFEQYGFNHKAIAAQDFEQDLASQYDAIVLPDGTSRATIVSGLNAERNGKEWAWAYGVGDAGWKKLGDWVRGGGTLVAIGSAVETARALLDLPIEAALPDARQRRGQANAPLAFFCPGSLLQNEFNVAHPVAFGMPDAWPVFFEGDQAYRLKPGFAIQSEVVSRYPAKGPILQSGWLLGEEFLRDQANAVAFRVGSGYVVTLGSQIDFRTQPRGTFKLLFNAIFHGPSQRVPASAFGTR
ncbi:MAG TPA: M14 metallopeptidase family protein [Vicinamibacterales bacterium]|nr:M14 metallopeptidase family protein [Vicinamibacterales bacterium]